MNRTFNLIGMFLVLALGGGLYQLKLEVEERDRALDELYRTHMEDQKAIRVLGAEWAYLNSPEYLQDLAIRHLRLAPTLPTQIIDDLAVIPFRPGSSPRPDGSITPRYPIPRAKPLPGSGSGGSDRMAPRAPPRGTDTAMAPVVPAAYVPPGTRDGSKK